MNKQLMDKFFCDIYLDWFNNFISIEGYAKYYGLTERFAIELINHSSKIYDQYVLPRKAEKK